MRQFGSSMAISGLPAGRMGVADGLSRPCWHESMTETVSMVSRGVRSPPGHVGNALSFCVSRVAHRCTSVVVSADLR